MSVFVKDVGKIWDRLFDHKGFLGGEISFILREFELKRKDKEVDNLFNVIENITEIKDTEIDRCKQTGYLTLATTNEELFQAVDLCNKFIDLEEKYIQDKTIYTARSKRKVNWENFMDSVTTKYSEINSDFESKKEELNKVYEELDKKLL